jgi:hypothetical protein
MRFALAGMSFLFAALFLVELVLWGVHIGSVDPETVLEDVGGFLALFGVMWRGFGVLLFLAIGLSILRPRPA